MTTMLMILIISLALLIVLFLAMPLAVVLYWVEDSFPGLLENLKFWAVIIVSALIGATLLITLPAIFFL